MAGALASHIGAPATAMIGGSCCLLGALLLSRHLPAIRADLQRALSPMSGDG
jgi:hypothetical protein